MPTPMTTFTPAPVLPMEVAREISLALGVDPLRSGTRRLARAIASSAAPNQAPVDKAPRVIVLGGRALPALPALPATRAC